MSSSVLFGTVSAGYGHVTTLICGIGTVRVSCNLSATSLQGSTGVGRGDSCCNWGYSTVVMSISAHGSLYCNLLSCLSSIVCWGWSKSAPGPMGAGAIINIMNHDDNNNNNNNYFDNT